MVDYKEQLKLLNQHHLLKLNKINKNFQLKLHYLSKLIILILLNFFKSFNGKNNLYQLWNYVKVVIYFIESNKIKYSLKKNHHKLSNKFYQHYFICIKKILCIEILNHKICFMIIKVKHLKSQILVVPSNSKMVKN